MLTRADHIAHERASLVRLDALLSCTDTAAPSFTTPSWRSSASRATRRAASARPTATSTTVSAPSPWLSSSTSGCGTKTPTTCVSLVRSSAEIAVVRRLGRLRRVDQPELQRHHSGGGLRPGRHHAHARAVASGHVIFHQQLRRPVPSLQHRRRQRPHLLKHHSRAWTKPYSD